MKKLLILLLAVAMMVAVISCGPKDNGDDSGKGDNTSDNGTNDGTSGGNSNEGDGIEGPIIDWNP